MPPKKKSAKAVAVNDDENVVTPEKLKFHYKIACRLLGIKEDIVISSQFRESEDGSPYSQLLTKSKLGPAGTRAIMMALSGKSSGMNGESYKPMKSIRIWKGDCKEDGTRSIAKLLKELSSEKFSLTFLELLDCDVGIRGCLYLGDSLGRMSLSALQGLELNYNKGIGNEGAINLCKGIKYNKTISKLHLAYCNIGESGAAAIGTVIAASASAIVDLNISGNPIKSVGLAKLSESLTANTKVKVLNLTDCCISGFSPLDPGFIDALDIFGKMLSSTSTLERVLFDQNHIDVEGSEILVPYLENNKQLTEFTIDVSLPAEIFQKLSKSGVSSKKKKGKGKKKKKK